MNIQPIIEALASEITNNPDGRASVVEVAIILFSLAGSISLVIIVATMCRKKGGDDQ